MKTRQQQEIERQRKRKSQTDLKTDRLSDTKSAKAGKEHSLD